MPEGYQLSPGKQNVQLMGSRVSDGYFETMATPIFEGRGFRVTDTASSARVAVVNETFARHYWPGQDPVGKRFRLNDSNGQFVEIVGVARNSKYVSVTESPNEFVYLPHVQNPSSRMVLMVETAAGPRTSRRPCARWSAGWTPTCPFSPPGPCKSFTRCGPSVPT